MIIDKTQTTHQLLVTVSEVNSITSGCTLSLFNQASNTTTLISLPQDSSTYPDRINKYELPTSAFTSTGVFTYTIKDISGNTTQTGVLKVVDETQEEENNNGYVIPSFDETDDDILIYNS